MPTPLVVHTTSWPYAPDKCPADADFIAWIKGHQLTDQTIFHMGPGGHHRVGIEAGKEAGNRVLALTCAPTEMEEYVRLASEDAELSAAYQCLFGDIHNFPLALLPQFDIITLFHLGEMPDDNRVAYANSSSGWLLTHFWHSLQTGGRLLLYPGSNGYEWLKYAAGEFHGGAIEFRFNSLLGFIKP